MTACNPPRNDRFCPRADVSRGAMAVYLVRTFHLTATSGVRFRDVPKHGSKAKAIDKVVTAGIAGRLLEAALLSRRHGDPRPDGRVRDQGAQADGDERRPVRRRLDAPPVRHRDQPARDGRPRHLVRQPPVLPEPRHQSCRDGRLPPAGQVHHPSHRGAAGAGQSGRQRAGAARRRGRRHVLARSRHRQRDAGELHLARPSSAPSPRAGSSPSTAARSRSRSRWPRRRRSSTTSPTSSSTAAARSRSTAQARAGSCT